MTTTNFVLVTLVCALATAGCSSSPTSQLGQTPATDADKNTRKRTTPVVAGRPARLLVWAGFDELDCRENTPAFAVAQTPSKGTVSFKPKQTTTIRHSNSGKCIGLRMQGTGVYYTANKGQTGADHFSITATTPSGQAATRSFQVQIVE